MKITIALVAAGILLRFTTPGPGSYYLLSTNGYTSRVVACGHATNAVHVTHTLETGEPVGIFSVEFRPDSNCHPLAPGTMPEFASLNTKELSVSVADTESVDTPSQNAKNP